MRFPDAWSVISRHCRPLASERIGLADALGRVLSQDAASAVDLPPFDRSAMDGYAVRASDTSAGVVLRLTGGTAAGELPVAALERGDAMSITTGAALPPGADAVLQLELSEAAPGGVRCLASVPEQCHVRFRGEDVRRGDVLAPAGAPLTLQKLSALASAGVGDVSVHRRPRVRVLATGSELLPIGAPPEPGRIHESNRVVLSRMVERAGAELTGDDTVADDPLATRSAIETALGSVDVLVISGGVSVGTHDHVKAALDACGVEQIFWRVDLRPGRPLWFGRRGDTLVFALPGNPLSSIVGCLSFVEPALRRLQGEHDARMPTQPARLTTAAAAAGPRTTFLAATLEVGSDGVLSATPLPRQGSHLTGALAWADGFAIVPGGAGELPAGTLVESVRLG